MNDYREMFTCFTKGIDPDIVSRMESDQKLVLNPVVCLKCGAQTLQGEKCCDEPIHNKV